MTQPSDWIKSNHENAEVLKIWTGYTAFGWELVAEIYEDCSTQAGNFLPSLVTELFSVKTLYSDVMMG